MIYFFLRNKAFTLTLLGLILFGGMFSYVQMGKLEDAPFTIKQALVVTSYPGASPMEVRTQVTDVLEESIQTLGELYYLKSENRAGLSKITVYVKKEVRAAEMQQLWDKLRRKVSDVQSKLPEGAGPSVVNDDFGDVLGVFYGLTGHGRSYRELEEQAKLIKNELLKVPDVAKVEISGLQTPTIDIIVSPSLMAKNGVSTDDIAQAFAAQNKVVDAGGFDMDTTTISAVIIEDERPAARLLNRMLSNVRPAWSVTTLPGSVSEAVDWFGSHPHPHILFLDIHLTDGDAFDFISQVHPNSVIIFTTAYEQFALRAFEVNSIDYLLKPFDEQRLETAINKFERLEQHTSDQQELYLQNILSALRNREKSYRTRFLIEGLGQFRTLLVEDIAYFKSEK